MTWDKRFGILAVIVLLLAFVASGATVAHEGVAAQAANLLVNPGFEGEYTAYQGIGEVRVASGWVPWWTEGLHEIPGVEGGSAPSMGTARPEYRAATLAMDAYRVRSGAQAQLWFNFSKPGYAGIYQSIIATKGATYQGSVWAQCWASNDDSNPHSCPWELYVSIGIDPDGGTWFKSRSIQWSQWQRVEATYKEFYGPRVTANEGRVTLYVSTAVKYAGKHGDFYLDDARLEVVSQGTQPTQTPAPTYTPQVCPSCPTPVPCATYAPGGECDCLTLQEAEQRWGWLAR